MNFSRDIFVSEDAWLSVWSERAKAITQRCTRCVYDNLTVGIVFDKDGVCNNCKVYDDLLIQNPGGELGERKFADLVKTIKQKSKNKKYDVIVGVSGGCDSSYMIHLAKEYGLRVLAVHFDNTYNSNIAVENIRNVLSKTGIDLWTHVVSNEEYDDVLRACFSSGIMEFDMATDLGLAATLNMAAAKFGIKYIFEGHSFRTEGVAPLGWAYMDSRYLSDVCKKSNVKKTKTLPKMLLHKQLKWMLVNRIKKIRPFWYLDYNKEQAKKILEKEYNWKWYGGHHLENRISCIGHTYYNIRRCGADQRMNGYSALVRAGQMKRDEAICLLEKPPVVDYTAIEYVRNRLNLSEKVFYDNFAKPLKSYKDYKNYKKTFERMRPFFYLMAKAELIPMSFYMKYTKKQSV